jgi:hypothetical protein
MSQHFKYIQGTNLGYDLLAKHKQCPKSWVIVLKGFQLQPLLLENNRLVLNYDQSTLGHRGRNYRCCDAPSKKSAGTLSHEIVPVWD